MTQAVPFIKVWPVFYYTSINISMHQFANMPMPTQSRMQQIDTLANYPMGTKPDSFRLIKRPLNPENP